MSKHSHTKKHSNQPKTGPSKNADTANPKTEQARKEGPACHSGHVPPGHVPPTEEKSGFPGQTDDENPVVDAKRSDEQQYHAAGVPRDPHDRLQEQVDRGDPQAGDIEEETRSDTAPFNKTYGRHE